MTAASITIAPLRSARREFTRARFCLAAKNVFLKRGYAAATMEEVARAAGSQRSTLYTYFGDKDALLSAIADDYFVGVAEVVSALPGPHPSLAEIEVWVRRFADFVARERVPTILVMHSGAEPHIPPAIRAFGVRLFDALAERLPAFAATETDGPGSRLARARANAVLRELGWALCGQIEEQAHGLAEEALIVAAELFDRFVNERQGRDP